MKVLEFPLTRITLCFIAGIIAAHYGNIVPYLSFSMLFVSALIFCIAYFLQRKETAKIFFGVAALVLSFCVGVVTLSTHDGFFKNRSYIHEVGRAETVHSVSIVLRERLKSSASSDRFFALVKSIDRTPASGKILVNFHKSQFRKLIIGTNLRVSGKISKLKPPVNPDQFDYSEYLRNKSVLAQMYVTKDNATIGKHIDRDAFYYSDLLRTRILNNLTKHHFHKNELAVIGALILGQQQEIAPEILHDYQFAGAIHILSVSGLHVGFLLLFINYLLNFLPKNSITSYIKVALTFLLLWGFAILAGLSPSVIRSVTMFSFVALGIHLKRKTNIFHTLLVSLFLILLFEPSFLFDVGFQLSYTALFFILWLQPKLSEIIQPKNKISKYLWEILTVSFAAQIGTFPLSVFYFHQFPGLFFVTNLIIIPFLSVIMALGVFVMLLAAIDLVPQFLSDALEWTVWLLDKIIGSIASFEQFIFRDIPFNYYMLWSLYVLIIAIGIWFLNPNYKKMYAVLLALILFQASYFGSKWRSRNAREWLVFNSRKSTLIVERNGEEVTVFSNDMDENATLKSFLIANFCHLKTTEPLRNTAFFGSRRILILDSFPQYPAKVKPDVVVLCRSPKINLDRMLQDFRPKTIVADATNYKSYVKRWKETCHKEKIPFHATAEKGFYRLQ